MRLHKQGICQFDVDIDENYMLVKDFRFIYVGYSDHGYTKRMSNNSFLVQ
jgi:hypothetical protein